MIEDIAQWLAELDLLEYLDRFHENGIDHRTLPHITDQDLAEIGVLLGHRRLILATIAQADAKSDGEGRQTQAPVPDTSDELRGERRQVVALFADISGFTALSNKLGAEETHLMLNRFFDTVDQVIIDHGGTIDKHIGDAVMAIFGAPVAHTNDTERALNAALALRQAAAQLTPPIEVHVGIAVGQVVASHMGSQVHTEYTVTGDSVNLASRLTDLAPTGEIYVSDSVRRIVSDRFVGDDLGPQQVQGLLEPVVVHRFHHLDDLAVVSRSKIVGRSTELAQFSFLLDQSATARTGQIILVKGEPGIGKTHLLDEVKILAEQKGYETHRCLVLDFGAGKGQSAIFQLVTGLLDAGLHPGSEDTSEIVRNAAANDWISPNHQVHLNSLLELGQPADLANVYAAMDNQTRIEGRYQVLRELISARSRQGPLAIFIEDIHWAEQETITQLAEIGKHIRDLSCLLVLTSRVMGDPIDADWQRMIGSTGYTVLQLKPLAAEDLMDLAHHYDVGEPRLLQECIERSGGNPLFMEQLLINISELGGEELPGSIQGIVQARLDVLDPADRKAIQAASILGQVIAQFVLAALLEQDDFDPTRLLQTTLLQISDGDLKFSHALIRDGAYNSLLRADRIALHDRAAHWFKGRDHLLYAHHLDLSENPHAVIAYLEAAQIAGKAYQFDQAIGLLRRGLVIAKEEAQHFDLTCYLGEMLLALARTAEAVEELSSLIGVSRDPDKLCQLHAVLAQADRLGDRYQDALANLEKAETAAIEVGSELQLAKINYLRGSIYFPMGNLSASLKSHEKALAFARTANSVQLQVGALSGFGDANYMQGHHLTAIQYYSQAIEIARSHDLVRDVAANLHNLSVSLTFAGKFDEAEAAETESMELARRYDLPMPRQLALTAGTWRSIIKGDWQDGLAKAIEALEISRRIEAARFTAQCQCAVARLHFLLGERKVAETEAREAVDIAREAAQNFTGPHAFGIYARLIEDPAKQDALLQEGLALLEAGCVSHNHIFFYSDAIAIALGRQDWNGALEFANRMEAYFSKEPLLLVDLTCAQARKFASQGRMGASLHDETFRLDLVADFDRLGIHGAMSGLRDQIF